MWLSLPIAISCSSGQRFFSPRRKPTACSASSTPSLSKSAKRASQPQPLRASAQRLAALDEGRDAVPHALGLAGREPDEVALLERPVLGDVADVHVEMAVAVEVAEVDAHALEGVAAQHLGGRGGEALRAGQHGEARPAGRGAVVEQAVVAEVVAEVDLRQQIAVEVGGAHRERPGGGGLRIERLRDLAELDGRPAPRWPAARAGDG